MPRRTSNRDTPEEVAEWRRIVNFAGEVAQVRERQQAINARLEEIEDALSLDRIQRGELLNAISRLRLEVQAAGQRTEYVERNVDGWLRAGKERESSISGKLRAVEVKMAAAIKQEADALRGEDATVKAAKISQVASIEVTRINRTTQIVLAFLERAALVLAAYLAARSAPP